MYEAIEDRVGISWVGDDIVPFVDRKLAGDDGRTAAVSFFKYFKEIVARGVVERLEPPIVQDEQFDASESPQKTRVTAVATGESKFGEESGDALIEDGAVIATSFVTEG